MNEESKKLIHLEVKSSKGKSVIVMNKETTMESWEISRRFRVGDKMLLSTTDGVLKAFYDSEVGRWFICRNILKKKTGDLALIAQNQY